MVAPIDRLALAVGMAALATTLAAAPSAAAAPPSRPPSAPSATREAAPSAGARALERFARSRELYDQGRFREAIELLLEAQAIQPAPVLNYNLGRAYEGVGDLPAAIAAYERYLAEERAAPDRLAIEERLRTLRRQLAEGERLRREREKARQESADKVVELAREREQQRRASIVPWVVAGVGAVGLTTGVVFGVVSGGRHDDAVAEPENRAALRQQSEAERLAVVANVTLIVSGVVAVAGVVWGLVDLRRAHAAISASRPPTHVRIGLGYLGGAF